ncbi:MAG: ribose-phosphate diphosphokinase [Spirochaetales bacterium]|nr:ribose-phosphate diphosphokinase [Spirochaetales bacterium]
MICAIPEHIGILACPGGAAFANRTIADLEDLAGRKFRKKIEILAARYGLSQEQVIRQVNLDLDLRPTTLDLNQPTDKFRPASFRIPAYFTRFANGEFKTEILTSIRNMDVYVVQDVENHYPLTLNRGDKEQHVLSVNDHVFCLLVTIDAALHAGANSVTAVLPTYPYSRQHKKKSREGLTAARLGQFLEFAGVDRIITLDLHCKEIENSFNRLRLEDLHASYQILRVLSTVMDLRDPDLTIVSPDSGSIDRNKFYASALGKSLGLIYKERDYSKVSRSAKESNITSVRLLGSVEGKTVFIADDMLGTGGTLLRGMAALRDMGAKRIICAVSLPFFSGNAMEVFDEAYRNGLFHRIIGTNAVYHDKSLLEREWYLSADITYLFARSIYRLHSGRSLSSLLDNRKIIQNMLDHQDERNGRKPRSAAAEGEQPPDAP